jgi:glycosyltransferase involved in cell wall biosynthesis
MTLTTDIPQPADSAAPAAPDPALRDVSIIIPAYNEEQGLSATLRQLRERFPLAELIVVDDGSTDRTAAEAERIPEVRLLRHPRNRGYGAALKTGMRAARRPCVLWCDGDGQHAPADVAAVAAPVLAGTADMAIGVRGRDSVQAKRRLAGKAVLYWVARLISREAIPDLNSGLRCFRREVILRYLHLLPDTFSASTTSTLMMLKRGYRVGYVPIVAQPRIGHSSVRIVADGLRTIQLIVRIIVLFEAFRVFTLLGLLLLIPGMIYGVTRALLPPHAGIPTLAGIMMLAGLLTIFMGIIADQVTELRKERFESQS